MLRRGLRRMIDHRELRKGIEDRIDTINSTVLRPLDKASRFISKATYSTPMVILLGNHSAGKSTFINSVLGKSEQHTGVAPTDDGFTVIMRGDVDLDEDGKTAVSNPEYGFADLKPFGPNFVNHFRLKIRQLPASSQLPHGMMIIDTPGMIDTPVHVSSRTSVEGQNRGYDFIGVTRWFAQRADKIFLLFDPANPGTTGETLDVLTNALHGQEHKFSILFNKVDTFDQVVDFARTYGTLTWNLSKVIKVKDIPKIYTTFTKEARDALGPNVKASAVPLAELDRSVQDVVGEVMKAPLSRLDNLITEADEAAHKILMFHKVQNAIHKRSTINRMQNYAFGAMAVVGVPLALNTVLVPLEMLSMPLALGTSILSCCFAYWYLNQRHTDAERRIRSELDSFFAMAFPATEQSAEIQDRWKSHVRQPMYDVLQTHGPEAFQGVSSRDIRKVHDVIAEEIPELRKRVSEYKRAVLKE